MSYELKSISVGFAKGTINALDYTRAMNLMIDKVHKNFRFYFYSFKVIDNYKNGIICIDIDKSFLRVAQYLDNVTAIALLS